MLIVASDRLSAFDVIFDQPILDKGIMLTSIANYWFEKTSHIVQNHLTKITLDEVLPESEAKLLAGRAIVVKKLKFISYFNRLSETFVLLLRVKAILC